MTEILQPLIVVCGDFNEEFDEVSIEAIRRDGEHRNLDLAMRVMVPTERNIPEPARYSFLHNGKGKMLDHILVSRTLLAYFRGSEVRNELLHDESIVFTPRIFYPKSDHAPVVAEFELPESRIKWAYGSRPRVLKDSRGKIFAVIINLLKLKKTGNRMLIRY